MPSRLDIPKKISHYEYRQRDGRDGGKSDLKANIRHTTSGACKAVFGDYACRGREMALPTSFGLLSLVSLFLAYALLHLRHHLSSLDLLLFLSG